jgi:acyl-CoA dehydrogenase
MDFILNDEQRLIYEYGGQLAQKYDNAYWLRHARKHEFPKDNCAGGWIECGS